MQEAKRDDSAITSLWKYLEKTFVYSEKLYKAFVLKAFILKSSPLMTFLMDFLSDMKDPRNEKVYINKMQLIQLHQNHFFHDVRFAGGRKKIRKRSLFSSCLHDKVDKKEKFVISSFSARGKSSSKKLNLNGF